MEPVKQDVQQDQTPAVSPEDGNGANKEESKEVINVETHQNEISQLKEMMDQVKRSQAGSDKMNSELKRENEELKKSQMSDKERAEYERKLFEQEREGLVRERNELEKSRLIAEHFASNEIDYELREFISADSKEEVVEKIDRLKGLLEKYADKKLEKFRATQTGTPASGNVGASIDQLGDNGITEISEKYNKLLADKGRDHANAWLKTINIKR